MHGVVHDVDHAAGRPRQDHEDEEDREYDVEDGLECLHAQPATVAIT